MPSLLRDGLQPSFLLSLTVRVFRPFWQKSYSLERIE